MNRPLEPTGLVLLALVAAMTIPSFQAAETPTAFETPGENLDRDLKPIRAHVQSIKARMERGVSSVAADDPHTPALRIEGWAATCCTRSIRAAHARATSLEKRAIALGKLYQAEGHTDGAGLAGEIATDAVAARERLELFGAAPDQAAAFAALQNLVKAVINLNIDRRELEACCNDIQVPVPPDEPEER
jgi:hypothetical protein